MKKLIVGLCAVLSMSFAYSEEAAVEPQQTCQTAHQARAAATQDQLAQQVLCCCNTSNGQCCKYVSMCGSWIPGCWCVGHGVEAEPMNSEGTEGKVRI